MKKKKRRRCLSCRQLFHCHPRTRSQQKYCSAAVCRAASKKASQQRWLGKPENRNYFCGEQHVNRVQAWREKHPRHGREAPLRSRPLQETIVRQPADRSKESATLALQEMIRRQAGESAEDSAVWAAREIGRALKLSHGAVSKYRAAIRVAGLTWQEAQNLEDTGLERRIWHARAEPPGREIILPDCAWIHTELKRHKHVTLQLLWDEYHATHGTRALRYSSFCEHLLRTPTRFSSSKRT